MVNTDKLCGVSCWHPTFLQRFANKKTFLGIYGLLGFVQAITFSYFIVTLTTIEKRFQIPSSTTGIILSGNEVSQILLSLVLSYIGGQRNRPRWISWGVTFCAFSCFILASPHFFYGAGEHALKLTKEYMESKEHLMSTLNITADTLYRSQNRLCTINPLEKECNGTRSVVPLVLIFLSQFVLGIGNTLYYSLGQSYLDDNIHNKKSTPIMMSLAFSFRMLGPALGFFLAFGCLKLYIDPTKTPIIDSKDPRWLGAWWLGWVLVGFAMLILAFVIGLFPKEIPKRTKTAIEGRPSTFEEETPLNGQIIGEPFYNDHNLGSINNLTARKVEGGFFKAVKRLLKNKLLMCNIFSGVFYILGSSGYVTFIAKYMEVQFHRSAADATIITGPLTLFGMIIGMLASGYFISKVKPRAKYLLFWNVIVGVVYMLGQFTNLFLTCPDGTMPLVKGQLLNLTTECNSNCMCDQMLYTPVCHEESGVTFFSPCHAGCQKYHENEKYYSECSCASKTVERLTAVEPVESSAQIFKLQKGSILFDDFDDEPKIVNDERRKIEQTDSPSQVISVTTFAPISVPLSKVDELSKLHNSYDLYDDYDQDYLDRAFTKKNRRRRETDQKEGWGVMLPGACMKGCAFGFYLFSIVSSIINIFGASGKIGNILVNFRCVTKEDKSVTQGLLLMFISLFALIPGPIIFSQIIDNTCLTFTRECGEKGTCQLYDQRSFRYHVNLFAMLFTFIGTVFDIFVWWYGRNLELYEENEGQFDVKRRSKKNSITTK